MITGTGLKDLAGLKHLEHLNLDYGTKLTETGLKALAALHNLDPYLLERRMSRTPSGRNSLGSRTLPTSTLSTQK